MIIKREYAGHKRTLVVDDHTISGSYAVAALSQCPGQVRWVKTASAALSTSLSWHPHIICMDLHLPDTSGLEVISQILAEWPDDRPEPEIIVMTGDGSSLARENLALLRIDHLLVKPVSGEQLREVTGLGDISGISEPQTGEARFELQALFRDELNHRMLELDSGLSELNRKTVAGILHQLIASAAMSGESRVELSLRSLDAVYRRGGAPGDVARCYHDFLESAREFILRRTPP